MKHIFLTFIVGVLAFSSSAESNDNFPYIETPDRLEAIWAIQRGDYHIVDDLIEKGKFHPLWRTESDERVISAIYDLDHYTRGYKNREEADKATDRLIEGYRYLISRGDRPDVPINFGTMANSDLQILTSPVAHNNFRVVKFLFEEYGLQEKVSDYTESSMYKNGSLGVFKYLFIESKILKSVQCSAFYTLNHTSVKYMIGYDDNGVKKWKGFMDYWDELGIEYKHCFHPESYEWKLFKLDER